MFRRHIPPIGAALALCATVAGCGATARHHLSTHAEARLRGQLSAVRTAAGSGDRKRALGALSSFATLVRDDAAAGELTAAERTALQTGIARTRARIVAMIPATGASATGTGSSTATTATSTAPAPAPAPPPSPGPAPGKGHGPPPGHLKHGHGPGHGHGPDGPGDGGDGQGDGGG
ncbi:MAG: hypothetical protein ACRDLV_01955 [Solirubrobacteraceae bacterium]